MKNRKEYLIAAFCILGLFSLLLPVSTRGDSAIDLLRMWKKEDTIRMICLCAAILALGISTPVTLFSKKSGGRVLADVLALGSAVAIHILIQIEEEGRGIPGIGCWAMTLCVFIMQILSVMFLLKDENLKNNSVNPGYEGEESEKNEDVLQEALLGQQEEFPEFPCGSLYIECAPFHGASISLEHMQPVTIGTDASCCNLVVQGEGISRNHCTVTYNGIRNTYLLLDVSTNGTYLNGGQRIPHSFAMELKAGMKFSLAKEENGFRLGE